MQFFATKGINPLLQHEVDIFNGALSALEDVGSTVIEDIHFETESSKIVEATEDETVEQAEFAEALARYLGQLAHNPAGIENIHSLMEFTKDCPAEEAVERNMVGFFLYACDSPLMLIPSM